MFPYTRLRRGPALETFLARYSRQACSPASARCPTDRDCDRARLEPRTRTRPPSAVACLPISRKPTHLRMQRARPDDPLGSGYCCRRLPDVSSSRPACTATTVVDCREEQGAMSV